MGTTTTALKPAPFAKRETSRVHGLRKDLFPPDVCERMTDRDHLGAEDVSCNLFSGIRESATQFFKDRDIAGHGGGHWDRSITSSQVSCVNCLFPFVSRPDLLQPVLNAMLGDVAEVLPITEESPLPDGTVPALTFEWIDRTNRLGERGTSKRGRYVTNVDVLFRYQSTTGAVLLVLTEWKYRETTQSGSIQFSKRGTDRLQTYEPHFLLAECQLQLPDSVSATDLMFDPFDQLMRLQLLASILQRDADMEADGAVVLHIAPRANSEFQTSLNSPALCKLGSTVYDAWSQLVTSGHFFHFATEDLIPLLVENAPCSDWANYVQLRYGGMQ